MTATIAICIACVAALVCGFCALVISSRYGRFWKLGPLLFLSVVLMRLVDTALILDGARLTSAQVPLREFLPALVIVSAGFAIAQLAALAGRKPEGAKS